MRKRESDAVGRRQRPRPRVEVVDPFFLLLSSSLSLALSLVRSLALPLSLSLSLDLFNKHRIVQSSNQIYTRQRKGRKGEIRKESFLFSFARPPSTYSRTSLPFRLPLSFFVVFLSLFCAQCPVSLALRSLFPFLSLNKCTREVFVIIKVVSLARGRERRKTLFRSLEILVALSLSIEYLSFLSL